MKLEFNIENIKVIVTNELYRLPDQVLRKRNPDTYTWSDGNYIETYVSKQNTLDTDQELKKRIERRASLLIWIKNGKVENLRDIKKRIKPLFIEAWKKNY